MDSEVQRALEKQNPLWFGKELDTGIARLQYYPQLLTFLPTKEILLILGARRTGKSTLLYQLISSLNVDPRAILFINMDEPLFQSKADDPKFLGNLIEEYMIQHDDIERFYICLDEVQNYTYWAQTLKTIYDVKKKVKCIATGSTAALLKDAASLRLSGRFFSTIIYPLAFNEYLEFNKLKNITLLKKHIAVQQYLEYGGFPRVVLEYDKNLKQELLKSYFQTIYLKDIIFPHNLRNNKDIFELLFYLLSNISLPFSYNNIAQSLHIAVDTVKEYIYYAEQSYLVYAITKYDLSIRKQFANPRKIYCLDTGLVNSISFKFSENKGRLIENLVGISLIMRGKEIYYHKGGHECDFLVRKNRKIEQAIQVTVSMKDETVRKRELAGLLEAMNNYNLQEGIIITEDEHEILAFENKKIIVVPLHEWLL